MRDLASYFGTGLFLVPFLYVPAYLYVERSYSQHALTQQMLKLVTVMGGLLLAIYACTLPMEFTVLMPGRSGQKNSIPAPIFFVVVGIAAMALPLYSKYIRFSHRNENERD